MTASATFWLGLELGGSPLAAALGGLAAAHEAHRAASTTTIQNVITTSVTAKCFSLPAVVWQFHKYVSAAFSLSESDGETYPFQR
jgi:hypothetical protein